MKFEFLITCHLDQGSDTDDIIGILDAILQDSSDAVSLNEHDFADASLFIGCKRSIDEPSVDGANTLIGFSVQLAIEQTKENTENIENVIREFGYRLYQETWISHVVKFEDAIFEQKLFDIGTEIYAIEMKLRRVLSIIYLKSVRHKHPFDLFSGEKIKLRQRNSMEPRVMRELLENQFFRFQFTEYIQVNQRQVTQMGELLEIARDSDSFEAFRQTLMNNPISTENDVELLSSLTRIMEPIEKMRNCVAHNRHPTGDEATNYVNARDQLIELLDNYLSDLD